MITLEQHFDACFCINLDRRTDRWEECREEVARHFGTAEDWVHRWSAHAHPTNGHQGCTRSHRELLRHIVKQGFKRVLVLEDDFAVVTLDRMKEKGFVPTQDAWKIQCMANNGLGTLNQRFGAMSYFIPDYYDVLYLGAGYGENPFRRLNKHVIRCGLMQTTSSYGISGHFAKIWSDKVDAGVGCTDRMSEEEKLARHPGPIDNVFGSMSHDHAFYVLQPRLLYQRTSYSNITDREENYLFSMTDPRHELLV